MDCRRIPPKKTKIYLLPLLIPPLSGETFQGYLMSNMFYLFPFGVGLTLLFSLHFRGLKTVNINFFHNDSNNVPTFYFFEQGTFNFFSTFVIGVDFCLLFETIFSNIFTPNFQERKCALGRNLCKTSWHPPCLLYPS